MNGIWIYFLRVRADIVYPLGLVLAAGVTLHVLLRKREVAPAVGWIGLAWFAPITGAISYVMFGINRVQRRAQRLRPTDRRAAQRSARPKPGDDDHLDPLVRGVGRITGRALVQGNRFEVLNNGDEAYPRMLEAIAAAQHSVGLSSYIFRTDKSGMQFIEALAAAHDRGLAVRVLVDGIGAGWLRSPAYHALRRRGVPVERFLHSTLPWRMPFLNLRSHKKILVVDGRLGFTGGINIADENVMATNPKEPVQDTHFRIEGPVVGQLTEAFAQDWAFATEQDLDGEDWFPTLTETGQSPARVIDSGPDDDLEKIEFAILQAISCARERIAVMTPYFLADDRMMGALSLAALRGVAVDFVIPQTSDHRFVDWACHANVIPTLLDGVKIWRCPPPFRHSKIMVVDSEWCLLGSCNWDMRSFRLNFELNIETFDRELAAKLTELMQSNRGPALTTQELDARSLPVRLRDAATRLLLPYL